MPLEVFNYLTRKPERFYPRSPQRHAREYVRMHVGGPRLRDHAHLGHARTYIAMDVVLRYLRDCGYQVRYIRSYWDAGHPTSGRRGRSYEALGDGTSPMEVAEGLMLSFQDDMDSLGVVRPNITPRATCHVSETIAWIAALIDLGYAYEVEGNVYCSVDRLPRYGELGRSVLDVWEGDRVFDASQTRDNLTDFPLWERTDAADPTCWPSPWGDGRPGWSIGCSVMATKHLGPSLDIHGGDVEGRITDFDREIALSEAHNQVPFAHVWLLVGSLRVNGRKMSQSLGNFLTIKDALKLYSPEAIRHFVLSTHYRSPLEFSRDALQAAQRGVNRLHRTVHLLQRRMRAALPSNGAGTAALSSVSSLETYRARFRAAMDDDFNTPEAAAVIFDLNDEVSRTLERGGQEASLGTLSAMDKLLRDLAGGVLGLVPTDPVVPPAGDLVADLVDYLLALRVRCREAQDWAGAEAIAHRLDELGIAIADGPFDTTWRLRDT
jgi:cysteinyl-tRNA synthetase